MSTISRLTFSCVALSILISSIYANGGSGNLVTYTGFTVTDGQIGSWKFHNARVILTYVSNTDSVQTILVPNPPTNPSNLPYSQIEINSGGSASIRIVTAERTVQANFAPGQIFFSLDLGDVPSLQPLASFSGGRGVGFGSYSATAPGGFEPTYPLGVEDGTIDWGDIKDNAPAPPYFASAELRGLPIDLQHDAAYSGRGWVCLGFPNTTCPKPTTPLKTDQGDLFLYQPYQVVFPPASGLPPFDTLNGAFITVVVGNCAEGPDLYNTSMPLTAGSRTLANSGGSGSTEVTYTGALVTNARLGGVSYNNAQVYISVDADSNRVVPFKDATSSGVMNQGGEARLKIISGQTVVTANLAPDQVYVYYDRTNGSAGIGSMAGGRGYPLSLTSEPTQDYAGWIEESLVGAITDLLNTPTDAQFYTAPTTTLTADLKSPTLFTGAASSCVSLNPANSICSNLNPIALQTDRGDFYLYEPYTVDTTASNGTQPFSINWGFFWVEVPPSESE